MKILVKKNNKLMSLGEGKIFSKRQLMLKEDEHTGFLSNSVNIESGARDAQAMMNKNSTLTNGVDASADDATSGKKNGNSTDPEIRVNTKDQNSIKVAQHMINTMSPQERSNVDVNFFDGTKQQALQTNSVKSRKVMDEIRKNSIPFTKKELSNFLMEL